MSNKNREIRGQKNWPDEYDLETLHDEEKKDGPEKLEIM